MSLSPFVPARLRRGVLNGDVSSRVPNGLHPDDARLAAPVANRRSGSATPALRARNACLLLVATAALLGNNPRRTCRQARALLRIAA
jgi:hypothetical protein